MNPFTQYLQSQGKSHNTIRYYDYYLQRFLFWLQKDNTTPESVSPKEITGYLQHLQKQGQTPEIRSHSLTVLNHYFDYLISVNQRESHPSRHLKIKGIKQNKLYPVLTRQQLESIYLDYMVPDAKVPQANRNWFPLYRLGRARNKIIIGLLVYQGLTTSEIERLEVKDIDLRSGTVYIKGSRKSNDRSLELKPGQIMDLMEYQLQIRVEILNYHHQPTEAFFLSLPRNSSHQAGVSLQIWKGLVSELRKQLGYFQNFKQIRASVIAGWLQQYNLRQVQYMAGHKYVSSTEKYLLHQIEDLKADIDKFHPLG